MSAEQTLHKDHGGSLLASSTLRLLDQFLIPSAAVLLGLLVGAGLMLLIGINPLDAYAQMWAGIAATPYQLGVVLIKATPLLLTGLGLGFAFRSGVFNIGAEGQIYIGALAGTAVGIQDWGLPLALHLPLALVAGFVGGGIWAMIPGYLKARHQVNEVITTILLNYIAIFLVSYFTHGPLRDNPEAVASLPHTPEVLVTSRLPVIWPGTRLHAGFLLALLAAGLLYFIMFHTSFGYKARTVGSSPDAARYAGMSVVRVMVLAMLISGGLAGLAGTSEILGVQRRLRDMFSPGLGFTAIAIALLGANNPLGIVFAAILFGALQAGANNMQALAGVPVTIVEVIQAVVIFAVAIGVMQRRGILKQWLERRTRPVEGGQLS